MIIVVGLKDSQNKKLKKISKRAFQIIKICYNKKVLEKVSWAVSSVGRATDS